MNKRNFIKNIFIAVILALCAAAVFAGNVIVKNGELNISDNLIVNTNTMFVNTSSNRVGIGTSTPDTTLDVAGNITADTYLGDGSELTGISGDNASWNQSLADTLYADISNGSLWEVDGSETQLVVADEIDMQTKKIINVVDPVSNQDAATKKYVDDNAGGTPTKEFFVQVAQGVAPTDNAYTDVNAYLTFERASSTQTVWFVFYVPLDFTSLTSAGVVIVPDATETVQWDMSADYGALGESVSQHRESSADVQQAVTSQVFAELDVSPILSSLSAGDYVGIKFASDTTQIQFFGLRIKYT